MNIEKWLFFIVGVLLLAACNSNEPEDKELKLSVADGIKNIVGCDANHDAVYAFNYVTRTEDLEYLFDVVSGEGNYKVSVTYGAAKSVVTGNHIKVDLLSDEVDLVIKDAKGQSAYLTIISSNKALYPVTYEIGLTYGSIMKTNVSFGTGKYSVLSKSGNSADISIDSNDLFTIKSLCPGTTYFTIIDQRGITDCIDVEVGNGWDLTSNELTVTATGGQYLTFPLKYGEGGWNIVSSTDTNFNKEPTTVIVNKDKLHEYDMLQYWVLKDVHPNPVVFNLKDKVGNTATITINVK